MPLLDMVSLGKTYQNNWVLENFQLSVVHGEVVGIMGPSGCGKSTLLRLIAGLERPDQGEILLEGKAISNSNKILQPHKRRMGMIFQQLALWPHLSVRQHFEYGLNKLTREERCKRVTEMMYHLQLTGLTERYPYQLSGGERQRVAFGRALIMKPEIILCDEPFNSLDQNLRQEVRQLFYQVVREEKITAIFVSHDPEDLIGVNRVIKMSKEG